MEDVMSMSACLSACLYRVVAWIGMKGMESMDGWMDEG